MVGVNGDNDDTSFTADLETCAKLCLYDKQVNLMFFGRIPMQMLFERFLVMDVASHLATDRLKTGKRTFAF